MSEFNNQQKIPFSKLAQRLNSESGEAWQVHEQALKMKRRGEDVVLLSIGDPDFQTPEPIIDNAVSHMRVGRTHYSPALGELNLRRAVADYETMVSPNPCDAEQVSIYPGVTAAIFSVMSCLLDAGDEIIIVDPPYVGYGPIMQALDAEVKTVMALPENGFEPQLDDFIRAISDKTKVVFINTPGNPTGAIIPRNTLTSLSRYCYDRGIWLVCDEVYSMLTYEKPHISLRTAAQRLDNVVVVDGLSKSHAMSGWRMGWAVAPVELTAHLGRFAAMSIFGCPQFIQDAAAFALNNDQYYVKDMCDQYQKRRDLVCAGLDEMPRLKYLRPQSGMFIMVEVSGICEDDKVFAQKLLDAERLSVLPGSAFGNSARGHIRLSLVQPENVLVEGCKRLQRFVNAVAQAES
ncbi:pyridoxal phosphate-dependent aminotransferase [Candidatus Spongiihabitans sp.]|uniref:pyridoxal phosphate-dependent aminotransferase n=1 Tax=Candidatus Spongiihabitans sp. TaxID=3101308 RepID=UPI003C6F2959